MKPLSVTRASLPSEIRKAVKACSRVPGVKIHAGSEGTIYVSNLRDAALQATLILLGFHHRDDQYVWSMSRGLMDVFAIKIDKQK